MGFQSVQNHPDPIRTTLIGPAGFCFTPSDDAVKNQWNQWLKALVSPENPGDQSEN